MKQLQKQDSAEWVLTPEQEFQEINQKVREIHLAKIISRYSDTPLDLKAGKNNAYMALCPYHGERRRSLKITPHGCKCYSCGFSGSTIAAVLPLLKRKYGHDFTKEQAILQIACDEKIIDKDVFERLSGIHYEFKERNEFQIKEKKVSPVKTDEELLFQTQVYEKMAGLFGLTESHKNELILNRKVRDLNNYFSFTAKKRKSVLRHLQNDFPEERLAKLPGFYQQRNTSGKWQLDLLGADGIGILIRDARGYVRAIQIRSDKPDAENKYTFLSCAIKSDDFIGGGSVGTPVNVIYPDQIAEDTMVAIVEGHFKAEILAQQGYIALSVQGVHNFMEIPMELKFVEQKIGRQISEAHIYYDADMFHNMAVFGALIRLSEYLDSKRPYLKQSVCIWDEDLGKGIDDLIFAGYYNAKRYIPADRLLKEQQICYQAVTKSMGLTEDTLIYLTIKERKTFASLWSKMMKGVFFKEKVSIAEEEEIYA